MMMKRFLRIWLGLHVIAMLIFLVGCTASWIDTARQLIPLIGPALESVLSLLALFGATISPEEVTSITSYVQQVEAGLTQLQDLINQYNAAEATAKPGLLSQIDTIAHTVQANVANILPTLHIVDPATAAKVTAVVNVVVSEIDQLVLIIPIIQAKLEAGDFDDKITLDADSPHPLTPKQFKHAFNQAMTLPTGHAHEDAEAVNLVLK